MKFAGIAGALLAALASVSAGAEKPGADVVRYVNDQPIRLKDLERALFIDDNAFYVARVRRFIIQERVVRQKMSDKGISVRASEIDGYVRDLERACRARKTSLKAQLKVKGMTEEFFRRSAAQALGLFHMAGGKGRPYQGMQEPAIVTRMNLLLQQLENGARVESDLSRLPPGVALKVNGEKVSTAEAARLVRIALSEEARQKRLRVLIKYFIVRQELERRKIEFSDDDIEFQIRLAAAQRTAQIGEAQFPLEKILEKLGRDLHLLKQQYGFRAIAMLTRLVKDQVTEKELRAAFAANRPRFGDGVPKAGHILLKTVDRNNMPLSPARRRKVKAEAEALYKRIKGSREDFAKLAGELSEDESTSNLGGNLGFIAPSRLDKAKNDAVARIAYALKVGEISRPVRGNLGWHIVKVTEIKRASFEEVKPLVMATAINRRRKVLLKELEAKAIIRPGPARF